MTAPEPSADVQPGRGGKGYCTNAGCPKFSEPHRHTYSRPAAPPEPTAEAQQDSSRRLLLVIEDWHNRLREVGEESEEAALWAERALLIDAILHGAR